MKLEVYNIKGKEIGRKIDLDKSKIKGILQDIYKLAREVAE